jgi:uncharacterized protein YhdP
LRVAHLTTFTRRTLIVIACVAVLLVGVRLALPTYVHRFVDKKLAELPGYTGSTDDIDLSLWRGAYQIKGLRIMKTGGKVPVPFVSAREIDLSVEWKALLHGSIVAEIELYEPKLNFVNAKSPAKRQTSMDSKWTDTVRDLVPFDINRFAIFDGQIHYRDLDADPRVDVFVQRLNASAHNLTNSEDMGGSLYASFAGTALAMGSGNIGFKGRIDPYANKPTFDLAFGLSDLELKQLNDFLQAYANVDAEAGTFSLDAEFSASHGKFRGYAKPFVKHLQLLRWNEEKENFFGKLWEGFVQVVSEIFENHKTDRIATRIPFSGSIEDPGADIFATIGGVLKNAFLQSLRRGIEGSVVMGGKDRASK